MAGHAPPPVLEALRAPRGITTMLPTEDAAWVGEELARRFGLPRWLFTLTATDANRTALRIARHADRAAARCSSTPTATTARSTRRSRSPRAARTVSRAGNVGPPVDVAQTTTAIEFNDLDALEAALAAGEIACVLAEPAMTNMGIVLPDAGYHEALRGAHAPARDAADHRRDAHVLGRAGRLHARVGARAGPGDDRQGDRRRRAVRRARAVRRRRGADARRRRTPTTRTPAASAARWPATRSRWRRCGRRSGPS